MTSLPAGYYEAPLAGEGGDTFMGVWLPLKAPAAQPLGVYKSSIDLAKKLKLMVAMKVETGLPGWVPTGCLPTVDTPIATASPDLGAASPDMVADAASLKGFVIYVHGLSDGPPSICQLFEKLAGLGFVCGAPSLSDDDSNAIESVLTGGFSNLELLHTHRAERTRTCIQTLRKTYGASLPVMLIGYSTGCDTIRLMQEAFPRIYMGGPGWLEYATGQPTSAPVPGGPTLQVLAVPDATMTMQGFTEDDSTRVTGFPLGETTIVPPHEAASALSSGKRHLRVDYVGWEHGSFKHPPFAASEGVAWNKLLCGYDPWKIVDLVTGRKGDEGDTPAITPEIEQARADEYTEVIAAWLLAAAKGKP